MKTSSDKTTDKSLPHTPLPTDVIQACEAILCQTNLKTHVLAGDGSERLYVRLTTQDGTKSCLAMVLEPNDAQLLRNNSYPWLDFGSALQRAGVNTPKVLGQLPTHGTLLIDDLGDCTFTQLWSQNPNKFRLFFPKIIEMIAAMLTMNQSTTSAWPKHTFDTEKLYSELLFFEKHFAINCSSWSSQESTVFRKEAYDLSSYLSSFSKFFTHRDFHSANLMLYADSVWSIDFQDARVGSSAYDLVSICFDSYLDINVDERICFLQNALETLAKKITPSLICEIEQTWPAVLLQRQIKALGSFGFLQKKRPHNYLSFAKKAIQTLSIMPIQALSRWPFLSTKIPELCLSHKDLLSDNDHHIKSSHSMCRSRETPCSTN